MVSANAGISSKGGIVHFASWDSTEKIVQSHAACGDAVATEDAEFLQSASVTKDTSQPTITHALHARPARLLIVRAQQNV
jgi:hypothetical protein